LFNEVRVIIDERGKRAALARIQIHQMMSSRTNHSFSDSFLDW